MTTLPTTTLSLPPFHSLSLSLSLSPSLPHTLSPSFPPTAAGPSCSGSREVLIPGGRGARVVLRSHVLHLRGPQPCAQPYPLPSARAGEKAEAAAEVKPETTAGTGADAGTQAQEGGQTAPATSWLLLNGEIYSGLPGLTAGAADTAVLAGALARALAKVDEDQKAHARQQQGGGEEASTPRPREARDRAAAAIVSVFEKLRGPWAAVLYDAPRQCLWFGRDRIGRRSLCVAQTKDALRLCSLAGEDTKRGGIWSELPATGMFCAAIDATGDAPATPTFGVLMYPWASDGLGAHKDNKDQGKQSRGENQDENKDEDAGPPSFVFACSGPAPSIAPPSSPLQPDALVQDAIKPLCRALEKAVAARVATFDNGASQGSGCSALPHVAVLFSGGVDCVVLAALAARVLPKDMPIDLINVAFENRRRQDYSEARAFDVPDRRTALTGAAELQRVAPDRTWRLVGVNVTAVDLDMRRAHIRRLIRPLRTELDDSIGCAIWFAASGNGFLLDAHGEPVAPYTSTAPVLLLGMGADEQLGGYSRHRSAYERGASRGGGWAGG